MTPKRPAIVPLEVWEQSPEPVQIVMQAMVEYYEQRITQLEAEVRELTARLNQNSQNSSKPPSSDGPHVKRKPPKPPSGRKSGGQPDHPPHQRALVPVEKVATVITCKPDHCRRCGSQLTGSDPEPLRQQVVEVPPVQPQAHGISTASVAVFWLWDYDVWGIADRCVALMLWATSSQYRSIVYRRLPPEQTNGREFLS